MPSLPLQYLIDVCSINELDGAHGDGTPSPYSLAEQARVWAGLIAMFESGRARMISYAKDELENYNPDAFAKLRRYKALRETRAIILRYQDVNTRFPEWVDGDVDAADPWMVAFAVEMKLDVVTEEKRAAEQQIKRRRPKIPDAADFYGVRCLKLARLILDEGWLVAD